MKQTTILVKDARIPLFMSMNRTLKFGLLLLLGVMLSAATSLRAQDTQISITAHNTSIREVLKMIEAKSDFHFAYNNKLIDVTRKVDVTATNQKIGDILKGIFTNTDITYKVLDSQIILASAKEMGEPVTTQKPLPTKLPEKLSMKTDSHYPA